MKQSKLKTFKRVVSLVLLAALVAVLSAMPLIAREKAEGEEFPISILSAQIRQLTLEEAIPGGGSLSEGEAPEVTIPEGVKIKEFLAKNGDTLEAGDPIALLDRVSLMEAIASTQDALEDLRADLEEARQASKTTAITGPKGQVKILYAQAGDAAADVMAKYGALAVLSLDGNMVLELETESSALAGDRVKVTLEGETYDATVESCREGKLRILLPDEDFPLGASATAADASGAYLGTGSLAIHSPWNAVAYSGTVKSVSARQGQTLYRGGTILTIEETGYSPECQLLAAQVRDQEEQMLQLFTLYSDQTLRSPAAGVVSGIDEVTAPMLSAQGGWQLQLLANAPDGREDTSYIHFVGQVTQLGTDGMILRLNPQILSVSDYLDLSGVPTDTAAMTESVRYASAAPIYQRSGEEWVQTTAGEGDILLFAGDALGNIVWVIRMGSAPLPGQPDQPTDPSQPTTPSEPTEPSDPTLPSEPTAPSEPSEPTIPGGETTPSDPTLPGDDSTTPTIPGGVTIPGGATIPSFGGSYSGAMPGGLPTQEQDTSPKEIVVASVSPRQVMEIPITVDELDIHKIAIGDAALVKIAALSLENIPGTVTKIDHLGANSGGSTKYTVTVTVAYQEHMLPGMNASVSIPLGSHSGPAVPTAALETRQGKTIVYTALDPETGEPASPVEVIPGYSDGIYTIIEGLSMEATVYYPYYEALNS